MTYPLDESYLGFTFLVTTGMQLSFFAIAYLLQFDKVTDLAGTANFVLLALVVFLTNQNSGEHAGTPTDRSILVTVMVCVWGLRLGGFLLNRVLVRGKDDRFDEIRGRFWSFLGFWVFQIVWVWLVSFPVTLVNASNAVVALNGLDWFGFALWLMGFLVESVADQVKYRFTRNPANRGKWIDTGVWSWSRHPNYFGEISCWFGIFLISISVTQDPRFSYAWVAFLSPLVTFVLLMFVSGMPGAEKRSDEKFGKIPEYREYKRSTSPLIPMPKFVYRSLPKGVKEVIFFEYSIYSKYLPKDHESDLGNE